MKNDSFDNSIRQKLAGHEAPVPAGAWENIQNGKRKKRPLPFFLIFAGLLLCGGAGIVLYKNVTKNKTAAAGKKSLKQTEKPGTMNAVAGKNNSNEMVTGTMPAKKNTMQVFSERTINDGKNNMVKYNNTAGHTTKPVTRLLLQSDGRPATFYRKKPGANTGTTGDDATATTKKKKYAGDAKMAIAITAPHTGEDNLPVVQEITHADSTADEQASLIVHKPGDKLKADTVHNPVAAGTAEPRSPGAKKKIKTGIGIDLALSGFIPIQNQQRIVSLSRTMETPLHKAELTAGKIRIRLQPSWGLNLVLFKKLSAKTTVGAGLGYAVIKEYIDLSGEEVNTTQRVIQRLHNGNSLVNDTVTTVTSGIRNIHAVNSYRFLSIPVSIRYQLMQRSKWTLDLQAGIDINLQSRYSNSIAGTLVPQFSGTNTTKRNHSIGTGFNAAIRLNRRLNKNYLLYAAPYFQVNPRKLYLQQMPAPVNIHRLGLSLGASYRL